MNTPVSLIKLLLRDESSSRYIFEPLLSLLTANDKKILSKLDAATAVESGAYETEEDYLLDNGPFGLADIAEMLVLEFSGGEFDRPTKHQLALSRCFEPHLASPQTCARLLTHRALIDLEILATRNLVDNLQLPLIGGQQSIKSSSIEIMRLLGEYLIDDGWTTTDLRNTLSNGIWLTEDEQSALHTLYDGLAISTRHGLVPTKYRLYVPPWLSAPRLTDAIDQAIIEAAKNPRTIQRLSPRDFERFLGRIFESFGYEVQVTSATRDGGADLICLGRQKDGISIKVAIEAKRYNAERPINVGLVRQFVGANAQWKANKLVYVTTSRYTKSAVDYSGLPEVANLLELKALPDIISWTEKFIETQYEVGL